MPPGPTATGPVVIERSVPRVPNQTGIRTTATPRVLSVGKAEITAVPSTRLSISDLSPKIITIINTLSAIMPHMDHDILERRIRLGLSDSQIRELEINRQLCEAVYQRGRAKELMPEKSELVEAFFKSHNGTAVALLENTDDKDVADLIKGALASKEALSTDDLPGAVTNYSFRGKLIKALDAAQPATVWKLYNDATAISVAELKLSSPQLAVLIKVADEAFKQTMLFCMRESQAEGRARAKAMEKVAAYIEDFTAATEYLGAKEKTAAAVFLIQSKKFELFSCGLAKKILKENPVEAAELLLQKLTTAQSSTVSRARFFFRWIGGEARSIFDLILQIIADVNNPEQLKQIIGVLAEQQGGAEEELLEKAIDRLDQKTRNSMFCKPEQAIVSLYHLLLSSRSIFDFSSKAQLIKAAATTIGAMQKIPSDPKAAHQKIRTLYLENLVFYKIGLPYLLIGLNGDNLDLAKKNLSATAEPGIASVLSIIGSILPAETYHREESTAQSIEEISLFQELKMPEIMRPNHRLPYHTALRPVIEMFRNAMERNKFARIENALKEVKNCLQKTAKEPYSLEDVLSALLLKSIRIMAILKEKKRL